MQRSSLCNVVRTDGISSMHWREIYERRAQGFGAVVAASHIGFVVYAAGNRGAKAYAPDQPVTREEKVRVQRQRMSRRQHPAAVHRLPVAHRMKSQLARALLIRDRLLRYDLAAAAAKM